MSLLENAVAQEQRRIEYMIEKYEAELANLPKGALIAKMIKGNQYYKISGKDQYVRVSQREKDNFEVCWESRR